MRHTTRLGTVFLVGLVVVVLLATGHATPVATPPIAPESALVTDRVAVPRGMTTAPLDPSVEIEVSFTLAFPHAAALDSFLSAVETPSSPQYRDYVTYAQFENLYAPTPAAENAVVTTLAGAGAQGITVSSGRLSVSAEVTVGAVEALLGVDMVAPPGGSAGGFYTTLGTPTLPTSWAGLVSGIDGLSHNPDQAVTLNLEPSRVAPVSEVPGDGQFAIDNATGETWFVGSDFTQMFQAPALFPGNHSIANATYPSDVAIATLLASGYNTTLGGNLPPWDPAVISAYYNNTLAPGWPHSVPKGVPVTIAGITPPLPGSFGSVNDSSLDEFENSLDLEMAGSLAPGAPLYNFYFAGSLLNAAGVSGSDVASYFDQDLAAALSYNYSPAQLGVVTCSFGVSDLNDSTWDEELEEAAAMGVTVVAASGDQGNAPNGLTGRDDGQWPIWPATAAFNTSGVVSVGGVSLAVSGAAEGWFNGTDLEVGYDSNFTGPTALSTWWDTTGGPGYYAGSEGGISAVYSEPGWQLHSAAQPNIVNATVRQGAGVLGSAVPDVAFPANSTIAFVEADAQGNVYFTVLEGTSIAAPAFAGFLADEIAVAHHDFGFLDPEIYRIESYYSAFPGGANPFLDVTNGSNYVFAASSGWDPTTGWGTPVAPLLFAADANAQVSNYTYAGPTPGLPPTVPPPPVPWTEIFLIFGVGAAVAVALILVMARPTPHPNAPPPGAFASAPPPPPPTGFAPPGPYAGPTFLCPFCGALRPAEPVRCPRCGAF